MARFLAALPLSKPASAQRGNDIDSLLAQMNTATQTGHWAEGLAAAQKLENLVRRRQGADNMNYAGVLHNGGMFLHNLGRFGEAVERLNAALANELCNNDAAGCANFLGMAGRHRTFHTPADDLNATGPELLEPIARAFVDAVRKIIERGDAAFG